jgi:hypothetical protein
VCLVHSKAAADEALERIRRSGDRAWEEKLARFADEDTTERPGGLFLMLEGIKHLPPDLRSIKKIQIGRHRAYITGHYSLCEYDLHWVKTFKKSGRDQEGDSDFQRKLLQALDEPRTRTLPLPALPEGGQPAE